MTASLATGRIANFSAGPSALPLEVLEEAREDILSLAGSGIGVMEHSHRGKEFVAVLHQTEADCRELMGLSDEFAVLFLSGGATTQFFSIPMSFLQGGTANYIDTGVWSSKAIKEAKAYGNVHIAASSKDTNYDYIPTSFDFAPGAKYTHYTSNNTIYGSQFHAIPEAEAPLVCDASSDILCRPSEFARHTVIYAGAQKNLGPAGCTLVVMKKDFMETGSTTIPKMLQYREHAANESCLNTPPTFAIYLMGRVFNWIKKQGGLEVIGRNNEKKAATLYDLLDSSDFWRPHVKPGSRSIMNVTWRLPSEELEGKLVKEATAAGYSGLKGHRSVGGLRASIYNAVTLEQVQSLVEFLKEFERKNG
jgi:phosphoserine aminotransferase